MSYFTDDTPHKSTSEPLIVDKNNLPEPELGLWGQITESFINEANSGIATSENQNLTDQLNSRTKILEEQLGPNYIDKLKDFGYEPGFLGAKGKDPWLSSGREETFEKAIKNLRSILPAETRTKLFAGDELEVAAAETARQIDKETSKKLQNTKYGWWGELIGRAGAHLTDPIELIMLGFVPNAIAGRIIAQGGKTSLASRTGVYAGTEAGVAAAFETPNQFLNVKGYKEELGLKYTNTDAAQAVFAATVLSAVGAGAFELGAGGLRKLRTGEWGISEYNSHVAKHYDQMSPELKHAHELVDQATENGRLNPFGDTPEGVQRHIDETLKAERFVNQEVRDVPQGDIEAAQDLAKQIEAQTNELPDVQKLREEFLEEHQLTQAPKPEGDIPDGFAFLNDVANEILPENVRVQIVDEIGRNGAPSRDFSPSAKEAATNLVDDIAGGDVSLAGKPREIAIADTPEGTLEIEKYGSVGSKDWAKNKAAEARRGRTSKTIDHTQKDNDVLYNLKEFYEPEDGISSKEFMDLLHRHPVKGMLFHSLDDGKTWYDPAGLMEQRNLITDGVDADDLLPDDISKVDRIDTFLESLPDRIYKEDGSLISVNPYGKVNFEPIARNISQSGDLLHNFEVGTGWADVHEAPKSLLDEHGLDEGFEVFIRANKGDGPTDVRLLIERRVYDADEVDGEIVEFEIGTKEGEKLVYDNDNDGFLDILGDELHEFGLIKSPDDEYEPLRLSWQSVFDDSLEALGPEYRSSFVSVDGKFYSTSGSLKYITDLPDDPQFSILKHNAEVSEFMSHAAKFEPEVLLERFAGRQTFEQPKNQPLLGRTLDQIEQDPGARSIEMGDDVYYQSAGDTTHGSFTPAHNLIQIARSAVDPTATLRHEAIHALKNLNLFKAEEWDLLEETARQMDWIKKHDIEARYKAEFEGDEATRQRAMLEESIAEEFSKWRRGELEVTQEIKTIFERIQALLGQIAETLRRAGINDFEDVFKRIESGEVQNRAIPDLRDDIQYEIGVGTKGETVTPRELVERADYELQQAEAIGLCLKVA